MSTIATAPPAAEQHVGSQEYVSTCLNLTLVWTPVRKRQLGEGRDFTMTQGHRVEFLNGKYVSSDPEEIAWLDEHDQNGSQFHKVGFGVDGQTADNSAQLIKEIFALSFRADYQKIADILVAERNSFSRPDVVAACESALNELGELLPKDPDAPPQG